MIPMNTANLRFHGTNRKNGKANRSSPGSLTDDKLPRGTAPSNPESSGNHCVFRHDHDPIADEMIITVEVSRLAFRCNHNSIGYARILVDDGSVNHTIAPDPDRWPS